jgi:aspartoacylase/N-acyl-aromatic-L-amino acid amidohydrolase
VIATGVHGNEQTAMELGNYWLRNPSAIQRKGLVVSMIKANVVNDKKNVRYTDADMNDQFAYETLYAAPDDGDPRELKVARQIAQALGGKQPNAKNPDFVLDLHNTTANVGVCVIVSQLTPLNKRVIGNIISRFPWVNVWYTPDDRIADTSLDSLGRNGFTIEVGPVPHGQFDSVKAKYEGDVVNGILDYLVEWNKGNIGNPVPVTVFRQLGDIYYPNGGKVFPPLLKADYLPINKGDVIMIDGAGQPVKWTGDNTVWPVMIDEVAYQLEYNDAMSLTNKEIHNW